MRNPPSRPADAWITPGSAARSASGIGTFFTGAGATAASAPRTPSSRAGACEALQAARARSSARFKPSSYADRVGDDHLAGRLPARQDHVVPPGGEAVRAE